MNHLNRRNFIAGLTAIMGGALTPIGAKAYGAALSFKLGENPITLDPNQLKITELMADIIIPDTDTPGASAAGVHLFIDHMVAHYMTDKEAHDFIAGLDAVDTKANGFVKINKEKQTAIVAAMDAHLKSDAFYKSFKEITVTGYYTSEIGATQELIYDPVPGQYHEVPLADIGRAWAT